MNRIGFHHLETLLWIERLGTFSAAAERLNTTQPSISGRVRDLEARLGVRIFRKEGRRAVLTVQGREIVRQSEALWTAFENMIPSRETPSGIVRVGAGEIAAATILPAHLTTLQRELPAITIEVEIDLTAKLMQGLLDSRLDIIFLPGPADGPDLEGASIGSVDMVWIARPDMADRAAMTPASAQDMPVWTLPPHSPLHPLVMSAIGGPRPGRPVHSCNNVQTLLAIIANGGGIAAVPRHFAEPVITDGRLATLYDDMPPLSLPLSVAIRAREKDVAVRRFFAHARNLALP